MKKRYFPCFVLILLFIGMISLPFPLWALAPADRHLAVIDPGHGGTDSGVKVSDAMSEKDVALVIALSLQKELDKTGNIKVRLTRSTDRLVTTDERIKAAKGPNVDLFLSIHVNAGFGKGSAGYELYFPGFDGSTPERNGEGDILQGMARNRYLNSSVRLAQILQRNLEGVFPRKGRGLRNAPVPVLRGITIPAVVAEIGFSTNPDDRKKLADETVRRDVVQALARGIQQYFSGR